MKYLEPQQILFIHDQVVKRTGGSFGVRDVSLVESAVFRPRASFDGKDLYKTVFAKAPAFLQSLLMNHPFVDGNKRTALTSAGLFLRFNGYTLINTHKEEVKFAIRVDNEHLSLEEITLWLKKNSKKI